MSEIKSNKISPRKGTTTTIGDSGDSVASSAGSTITNAGTITTAGISGGTINNTTGSIYLRGEVDWQPSDIKTTSFAPIANNGYFINTTSGEITLTLPTTPTAGDVIGIKDYANTFDTNKCILNANGNKIQGSTTNFDITVEGSSIILIYVDATQGWVITDASKAADIVQQALFVTATGGTITEDGDYKIHTFTGPGTFTVSCAGNSVGSDTADYLVVAGGAGGGSRHAGGGGAGGFRSNYPSSCAGIPVSVTAYSIIVGAGGAGGAIPGCGNFPGSAGSNSVFSTITSNGGGGGGGSANGVSGGSGGGAGDGNAVPARTGGAGNTPPVSPPQGNAGGDIPASSFLGAAGGGGAGAVGSNGGPGGPKAGGAGSPNSITGGAVFYSGGGGGAGGYFQPGTAGGTGGTGGGATGATGLSGNTGGAGTANTGGGGGGGATSGPGVTGQGGAGGSGIVIIRYKFQ